MRRRNLRPCGRQRSLSACRPVRPASDLLGVLPVALSNKGSEWDSKFGA